MSAAELLTRTADRIEAEGVMKGHYSVVFHLEDDEQLLAPPEVVDALEQGTAPCGGVKFCLIGSLWAEFGEQGLTVIKPSSEGIGFLRVLNADSGRRLHPLDSRPVLHEAFDSLNAAAVLYQQENEVEFEVEKDASQSNAGDPDDPYFSEAEYLFEHGDLDLDQVVALVRRAALAASAEPAAP